MEHSFFKNIPYDQAQAIEQASRLLYELRENRLARLRPYGVDDEAALLAQIKEGRLAEHPAYDHYLSARILLDTRETLRRELATGLDRSGQTAPDAAPDAFDHIDLMQQLETRYAERLDGAPQLMQDALSLCFDNGLVLEIRIVSAEEYAFSWLWGEAELRIDTAPLHAELATFPNHFHDVEGRLRADPLTVPGKAPFANLEALIDALFDDPLLGSANE